MSIKALSDYTIYSRYARYLEDEKRRETWAEQVERVFAMHERKFKDILEKNKEFREEFEFAKLQVLKKRVLGSQRSLQFGGQQIERHNLKMFNCCAGAIDRLEAFNEIFYILLCGAGVGFSVQKCHIEKLPALTTNIDKSKVVNFIIPDSIEGWSDSLAMLISSYFGGGKFPDTEGHYIDFDYSKIRPAGAIISGGFKAPGPEGLKQTLEQIRSLLENVIEGERNKLKSIEVYDIIMFISDAVLSGGIRRAATLCMFSPDDDDMMNAKTGDWFIKNPQRARSNNSALLIRDEISQEQFNKVFKRTREFGEPGFIFSNNENIFFNPCCEISLNPFTSSGNSGFNLCNLTEINGKWCKTEEDFYQSCRASAILGTMQAAYTDFNYLGKETKEIVERDALLGCSITGMMDNPEILFNPEIQKKGASIILEVNEKIAKIIDINHCARSTCVKPAGSTSCVLGTASGIHPHHAKRYIRRVQANKMEFPAQYFESINPLAVEESVWSANNTDVVLNFMCEVPQGAITKNQLSALEMLEKVKLTQNNWVKYGTRDIKSGVTHNVSNTILVQNSEWDAVRDYIYKNKKYFAGISLLPESGDKDYPQSPFTTILTEREIVKEYGPASVFASGLIVDGLHAFQNNLWRACDTILGVGEELESVVEKPEEPEMPTKNGYAHKEYSTKLSSYTIALQKFHNALEQYESWYLKKDWIRRAVQFADRYFDGDIRRMTYCLKDVSNWKYWCDLQREYKEVDWSKVNEVEAFYESVDTMGAQACAGGKCEINF